jgi:hypothetical protein
MSYHLFLSAPASSLYHFYKVVEDNVSGVTAMNLNGTMWFQASSASIAAVARAWIIAHLPFDVINRMLGQAAEDTARWHRNSPYNGGES